MSEIASIVLLAVIGLIWLALLLFFRDPPRRTPRGLAWGDMLSPADGVISAIERAPQHETVNGAAVILRIFLSVLNVHVNRAPFDGEIVAMRYQPGEFRNAQTPESARVNEFNLMTLRIETGETIGLRQVSGMLARRIVCAVRVGDRVRRGGKFGMIKFGSTTELILPRPRRRRDPRQAGGPRPGGQDGARDHQPSRRGAVATRRTSHANPSRPAMRTTMSSALRLTRSAVIAIA